MTPAERNLLTAVGYALTVQLRRDVGLDANGAVPRLDKALAEAEAETKAHQRHQLGWPPEDDGDCPYCGDPTCPGDCEGKANGDD